MNKINKARFVFWVLLVVAVFCIVWYCFAFYEVAALAEGASDCGMLVAVLADFSLLMLPDKAKIAIENCIVGGFDDGKD